MRIARIRLLPWVCDVKAYSFSYAVQRLGHTSPALRPVRALLVRVKLTRFRGARQAFNGGFSDAQDASALFT